MDDVNMMSNLVCEEDLIKELKTFNIKFDDKEVLNKLKNICLIYDFTADHITNQWISFCSRKQWPTDLDLIKVELFEDESFRKEKLKLDSIKETKLKDDDKKNQQVEIKLDNDLLNEYGIEMNVDINVNNNDIKKNGQSNGQANGNSNGNSNVQTKDQTNVQTNDNQTNDNQINDNLNKTSSKDNCIIENKLNETVELSNENQIVNLFGGNQLDLTEWINNDQTKYTILPLNSELHITKPFKTSQIKIHESNEILNEPIDEMFELLKSKLNSESIGELGDSLFIGSISLEEQSNTKDKLVYFENSRLFKGKLKLDLTKVTNYGLFPGKIICFEGELNGDSKDCLIVNKFYDDQLLLPEFNNKQIKLISNSVYLMVASGPISPYESEDLILLENLLEQVKLYQPHFLILLGPFFDCRNDHLLFNCDAEVYFNKIMRLISLALENLITEAIIVPSTFDLNNYNIYPAPPFEHQYPKIKFMPNPSFLDLNNIVISISSVDIFRHLVREEIKNSDMNDQERICGHILTQKNLYPLTPPNQEINLEYSKLDFIRFNIRPHLFIIPSMIKNFIKNVNGSLFLNPECLSKGVFAKVRIDCPPDDFKNGSIAEFTKVEIIKNKNTKN